MTPVTAAFFCEFRNIKRIR